MTSHPAFHSLPLRQETLLSLEEGDELRCIGGRMQVRTAGMAGAAWGLRSGADALEPLQAWRMPCRGIVTVEALQPGTRFALQPCATARAQTQENRAYPLARRLLLGGMSALRLFGGSAR